MSPIRYLVVVLALLAGGCAQLPRSSVVPEVEPLQMPEPPRTRGDGAIFQAHAGYRPLFEDRRPRMTGDVITIVLDEEVSASKNSQSNANRNGVTSFAPEGVPKGLEDLIEYGFDLSGDNEFNGGGGSRANNTFTGTLTVMVVDVMSNGNLLVRGEKQIAINQGTEFIRFSGIVDPYTVTSANTVSSTQVAEARIEYYGDGYINEAQSMGWLQRFFLNISPL
ncbi:flagellar basal body L-ring protein FlgH [Parahaliea aestuarii]|uniref:Flagellar L-ring protein n=1 Tax=Parahaliea aestuarii TaxID=1852021 RepID=A0A5C9A230_9GAMM|nr:flagellar basal body L-ring protein FlgH [Parahaliea aestuarii]TXS94776.1 flagellar basal body L-ring protein FlgH [Parahaliea aestuarii]